VAESQPESYGRRQERGRRRGEEGDGKKEEESRIQNPGEKLLVRMPTK
jgi:hypothetical protein